MGSEAGRPSFVQQHLVAEHESEKEFACGKTLSHVNDGLESEDYCSYTFVFLFQTSKKITFQSTGKSAHAKD